jgi:aspartokinase
MREVTRARTRARGAELLAALRRDRVPVKRFVCEGDAAWAAFGRDDVPDWPSVRARLVAACGGDLALEEDLAAATVVGEGIGCDPSCIARALDAARGAGAEIVGHDASPLRVTLLVAPARLDDVVRALHTAFLE